MAKDEIIIDNMSYHYPDEEDNLVFNGLSLKLPAGIVSLVGQNGTGKSTLLLLSAGILKPIKGDLYIKGINSKELIDEHERQRYVSFIYQNMEFETEDNIGDLLDYVYNNSFHEVKDPGFTSLLAKELELESFLDKKTQEVSKGQLQRTIIAFSLLYGSKMIMMDEPVFAMEEHTKEKTMDFIYNYSKEKALSIYYSVHELDISQKYSDHVLLFSKDSSCELGTTEMMLTKEKLEAAYQTPLELLKKREYLNSEIFADKQKD